ncbi:MAG TPA: hypothetical protein VGX97_01455 [bacterium]|nr:hypothetical protein [bacterium]
MTADSSPDASRSESSAPPDRAAGAAPSRPAPGLFRQTALERLSSPDQLDRLMRVADAKGWIALAAMIALTLVVIVWAAFGQISTTVRGEGVLIREAGGFYVRPTVSGDVSQIAVTVGSIEPPGAIVATIHTATGSVAVRNRFRERLSVLEVLAKEGDYVGPQTPLMAVDRIDEPLIAVVYLPVTDGQQVQPGMRAAVSPTALGVQQYGFIRGHVLQVNHFPSTIQGMTSLLGNATLVQTLFAAAGGTPIKVRVGLDHAATPSGLAWSASDGPPEPLRGGIIAEVEITLHTQRPASLVLPVQP